MAFLRRKKISCDFYTGVVSTPLSGLESKSVAIDLAEMADLVDNPRRQAGSWRGSLLEGGFLLHAARHHLCRGS